MTEGNDDLVYERLDKVDQIKQSYRSNSPN